MRRTSSRAGSSTVSRRARSDGRGKDVSVKLSAVRGLAIGLTGLTFVLTSGACDRRGSGGAGDSTTNVPSESAQAVVEAPEIPAPAPTSTASAGASAETTSETYPADTYVEHYWKATKSAKYQAAQGLHRD